MISSSWGAPLAFTKGFNPQHVSNGLSGRHLYVYSLPEGQVWVGGMFQKGSPVVAVKDDGETWQADVLLISFVTRRLWSVLYPLKLMVALTM
ncbi:hypothetical protein Dsin_018251 [Dipteronia sinensis]|uniref:Uncharacterized protein n=1 Tax=Dipteronia sinensis TaxID=43782 RepID=A0AAE0E1L0_9ROSI|nr:hypothetical protein Dsin_018251 [Dipteronia sinensis]